MLGGSARSQEGLGERGDPGPGELRRHDQEGHPRCLWDLREGARQEALGALDASVGNKETAIALICAEGRKVR